jgi:polyisoprenoid-binding protein YceI
METSILKTTKWAHDKAHSEIGFKVKHLMINNVKGSFREYNLDVETEGDDFTTAIVRFSMNPASIDTGDETRDRHLRSADFFDVEKFREITFVEDKIEKLSDDNFKLYGNLTMKGISRKVALDVEFGGMIKDPWGNTKAGFTVNGKINRREWGLNWNAALETGGVLLSDEVRISCDIQLLKK